MTTDPTLLAEALERVSVRDRYRLQRQLERAMRGGQAEERDLSRLATAITRAEQQMAGRRLLVPTITYPALPVSEHREEIKAALERSQVVVVAGETGSGKTTQLPKMCLELGRGVAGMIGHTQPRRIAARTVAERLAAELGVELGDAVGYAVRFTDTVSDRTLVKVMTDGILLAEIRRDRLLNAYDTIIVDEAHERSLNIDFLLGYLTQLLPRRPDLKVVVTSATIDTARFAAHFHAPVVEVSGRSYPVEIRYRPLLIDGEERDEDQRDPIQALCAAVDELAAEGPGDILVFLPGERDIRDAADALRERRPTETEVLPLYARLSAAEQHRVFEPHRSRRVVLATNVAETSLTVPGIRYVVDTGLARISRYSHRSKVQRLPIEPVSKASANQRAGRCGRIAPGICIRLYAEDDFAGRDEFTDPEILRTNLASVILQMAAIGLGDIEHFPFLEPPDRRAVTDGRALLEELGAFERRAGAPRLTPLGRRLAELPLDPRLGRMVIEGERRNCLREVTIIAAALSIQDPRERPLDKAQQADELHRRFVVPDSDFLSFVRLWDYLAELQSTSSGNQFRRRCRSEFLNVLRIREWQDVAGQIRQSFRSRGVHANVEPAPPAQVHQALLAGLLSLIGMRDRARGDYLGARTTRWQIGRSSSLSRKQPAWAMAAALVETERTWARTVAKIEPHWAEQLGAHLLKRSRSEPWWDAERGEGVVVERATLFGLPVVAGRTVSVARLDASLAREMLIQHALVEEDWHSPLPILERIRAKRQAAAELVDRVRRHGPLLGEDALAAFFQSALPLEVTTGRRLERWWRGASEQDRARLELPLNAFVGEPLEPLATHRYPDEWHVGELRLPLSYRWEPGSDDDGVTVSVPVEILNQLRPEPFEWQVPGYRAELIEVLVRSLPKGIRRSFVPISELAQRLVADLDPMGGALRSVLADRLRLLSGLAIEPELLANPTALPDHLRMRFSVHDQQGVELGADRDLEALKSRLAPAFHRAVETALAEVTMPAATTWVFGEIPREVRRGVLRAYPTLIDEGASGVSLGVVDSSEEQAEQMWRATRRLLSFAAPISGAHVQRRLTNAAKLALVRARLSVEALIEDCVLAAIDAVIERGKGPAYDAKAFDLLAADARSTLADSVARAATRSGALVAHAAGLRARIAEMARRESNGALAPALGDIASQLGGLIYPGFVSDASLARLDDLSRYLQAIERRLARLPSDLRRDRERQHRVERVGKHFDHVQSILTSRRAAPPELREVRFMLEEFRVSLWAQDLGTSGPVSEERILRALAQLQG